MFSGYGVLAVRRTRFICWLTMLFTGFSLSIGCGAQQAAQPGSGGELQQAKQATLKYQDLNVALADGYEDIKVVLPRMGRHYMKQSLVDDRFEADRPELLVYQPEGGQMKLVAVEYAIPLDKSATAPIGFTGAADQWDRNTTFGLWTLHAWVHRDNPNGVFSPMNPLVP